MPTVFFQLRAEVDGIGWSIDYLEHRLNRQEELIQVLSDKVATQYKRFGYLQQRVDRRMRMEDRRRVREERQVPQMARQTGGRPRGQVMWNITNHGGERDMSGWRMPP